MKLKIAVLCGLAFLIVFYLRAGQNPDLTPHQIAVNPNTPHTLCTIKAATTQFCFASDGLWISLNGAAYVQVSTSTTTAGVTSIAVNGGAAQTGAVLLTIPSKATTVSTTTLQ